jgi:hypothetical protein
VALSRASYCRRFLAVPNGTCRKECFPRNACRIVDPRLFRFRIAAGGLSLVDYIAARFMQTRIDFLQFVLTLNLNAEMIQARVFAAKWRS